MNLSHTQYTIHCYYISDTHCAVYCLHLSLSILYSYRTQSCVSVQRGTTNVSVQSVIIVFCIRIHCTFITLSFVYFKVIYCFFFFFLLVNYLFCMLSISQLSKLWLTVSCWPQVASCVDWQRFHNSNISWQKEEEQNYRLVYIEVY